MYPLTAHSDSVDGQARDAVTREFQTDISQGNTVAFKAWGAFGLLRDRPTSFMLVSALTGEMAQAPRAHAMVRATAFPPMLLPD